MRHASKFAMDSSMVTRMCKLPEDIYSMLLICEAQDVVEAPLPLNPEENEVWVRGSCTWKVKARILDVASTDQCKDVLSKKHQQKTTSATTKESSVSANMESHPCWEAPKLVPWRTAPV